MKQGHNQKYKENVVDSINGIMTKAKDHYSGVQTYRQSLMKEINTFNNDIENLKRIIQHDFIQVQKNNITYTEKTYTERYSQLRREEVINNMMKEYNERINEIETTTTLGIEMNETNYEEVRENQHEIERITNYLNENIEEQKECCNQIKKLQQLLEEKNQIYQGMNGTVTYKENLRSIILDIEECLHLNDPKLSITYLKTINIQMFNKLEIKPEVILSLITHLSNDLANTIEVKLSFLIICLKKLSTQKVPSKFNYVFEDLQKEILTDKAIVFNQELSKPLLLVLYLCQNIISH